MTQQLTRTDPRPGPAAPALDRPRRRIVRLAATLGVAAVTGSAVVGAVVDGHDAVDPEHPVLDAPAEVPAPAEPSPPPPRAAAEIIQAEIDAAIADRGRAAANSDEVVEGQPATAPAVELATDRAVEPAATTPATARRPAYLIIQDEIDRALAERDG